MTDNNSKSSNLIIYIRTDTTGRSLTLHRLSPAAVAAVRGRYKTKWEAEAAMNGAGLGRRGWFAINNTDCTTPNWMLNLPWKRAWLGVKTADILLEFLQTGTPDRVTEQPTTNQ